MPLVVIVQIEGSNPDLQPCPTPSDYLTKHDVALVQYHIICHGKSLR